MEKNDRFISLFSLVISIIGIVCGLYTFYGIWFHPDDSTFFAKFKVFHVLFAFSTLNLDFSNRFEYMEIWNFVFYVLLLIGSLQFRKTNGKETRFLGFVFSVIFLNAIILLFYSTYIKFFILKWKDLSSFQIFTTIFSYVVLIGMLIISFKILKTIKSKKEIDLVETEHRKSITDTPKWQRFFHWMIDLTVMGLIATPLVINAGYEMMNSEFLARHEAFAMFLESRWALYFLALILFFFYYPVSEILFGATPAKFLTESRVVNSKAESPDSSTVFLRTLCRNIPFDALSFFAKRGWHDSLSETYVVKEKRTGFKTNKLLWILPVLAIYLAGMYFGKDFYEDHKASVAHKERMSNEFELLKQELSKPNTNQFYVLDSRNYYGDSILNFGFKIEKIEGDDITIKRVTGRYFSGADFSYAKNLYEQQKDTAQTFKIKKQDLADISPKTIEEFYNSPNTKDFFNSGIQYKIEEIYSFNQPFFEAEIRKDDNDYTNKKAVLLLSNFGGSATIKEIKNQNNEMVWKTKFPILLNEANSPVIIEIENYDFTKENISIITCVDSHQKKHLFLITTNGLTAYVKKADVKMY